MTCIISHQGEQVKLTNKALYICGDSFSSTDIRWPNFHWSERLAQELPEFQIKNLAYAGATNLSIASQIEKALADPDTAFVIVNGSDVFRIDLPNLFLKRKDKSKDLLPANSQYTYNDFKKIGEKIYTEIYKNSFVAQDKLYDLFDHVYTEGDEHKDTTKILSSFGMWSLAPDTNFNPEYHFSPEVYDAVIEYFRNLFDLNLRFHNDLSLLEGKLYKLYSKKIPFLYNLGGLVNQKSFLSRVFPDIIKNISNQQPELKRFYSEINLFDITEDSFLTDSEAPGFHIAGEDEHKKITKYYLKRIAEINAS